MTSIVLDDVKKEFGDVTAVDDVNLEIEDGEFVSIVGPSGCGKTTTLRLIAGLEQLTSGRIYFGDDDVSNVPAKSRGIGMVFQNLALYPHMTVRENMKFGLNVSNVDPDKQEERVTKVAKMLDISELLDREPSELSGGQQQRVAIGRTMVLEPNVFLLDEPLASLDAKLRVEIREELQELQKETGVTTIYVTHDQEQAMTMSDRVVVIDDGEIQQFASPERIYNDPENRFVSHFIGTPSINFIEGEIVTDEGCLTVPIGSEKIILTQETDDSSRLTGREVTLGIRPEHIEISDHSDLNAFPAETRIVEHTGANKIIHLSINDYDLTALVPEHYDITNGDSVQIRLPPEDIYLFDKETGDRIRHSVSVEKSASTTSAEG